MLSNDDLRDKIFQGDVLEVLKTFPNDSVHTCVTSPPYYALRSYDTATWDGGDPTCDHKAAKQKSRYDYSLKSSPIQDSKRTGTDAPILDDVCPTCGAIKKDLQIGLEKTPVEFIDKLTEIFEEVRRVLHPSGTCWIVISSSYNGSGKGSSSGGVGPKSKLQTSSIGSYSIKTATRLKTYKPKDMIPIPWLLGIALQKSGWWLRDDIIWSKTSCMVSSVTDRCTKSHEYILMLSKSRKYYFDNDAIREPYTTKNPEKMFGKVPKNSKAARIDEVAPLQGKLVTQGCTPDSIWSHGGKNKRSVWTVGPYQLKELHYATYSPHLISPCVLAGSSEYGACAKCNAPYKRVLEKSITFHSGSGKSGNKPKGKYEGTEQAESGSYDIRMGPHVSTKTVSWIPTCKCGEDTGVVPCIVLDPFMGSGTTALVSKKHGRNYVGIELSQKYIEIADKRLQTDRYLHGKEKKKK
jgi:DNA modification methylase